MKCFRENNRNNLLMGMDKGQGYTISFFMVLYEWHCFLTTTMWTMRYHQDIVSEIMNDDSPDVARDVQALTASKTIRSKIVKTHCRRLTIALCLTTANAPRDKSSTLMTTSERHQTTSIPASVIVVLKACSGDRLVGYIEN